MKREERRRKFHESLKQILFPPPPPPQEIKKEEFASLNSHGLIPGDELAEFKTSSNSEDERDCGPDKPTRAQRKRVRKKKMKEYDERRNGLIGPLMDAPDEAEGVRQNASEKSCIENDQDGEVAPCTNQSKVKHRRRAKKLAKEKPKSSIAEKSKKDCDSIESGFDHKN